jgi:branched-chain amino acid transport system ATP-binding protein
VPEGREILARQTVLENLELATWGRSGAVAKEIEAVIKRFPILGERRALRAGTLSGGEQQMVAMARALMGRPRVLVMDEPTMGLSPLFVDHVLELIQTVNRQGVTIFMVEQNASLALQIAHYGYVLQTGRIALSGPARDLLRDPRIRDAYLGGQAA